MNLRLAVLDLAAAQALGPRARLRLLALAGVEGEPAGLAGTLARGCAVVAAALVGFGLVLWIAANWASLGRVGQFALLQGMVVATGLGAWWRPALRAPLALLALLGVGALFAYFGQTYQSGADPWQLFALWAALALPLALGARSDVVWAPWALVAMTAVALWTTTHVGSGPWRSGDEPSHTLVHLLAWAISFGFVVGLGPVLRRLTGAGPWAVRTAITLTVAAVTSSALMGLFASPVEPVYGLGLLFLGGAALLLTRRAHFDVFALSAVALGLDTLLVCGLSRLLLDLLNQEEHLTLLFIGAAAAGLLAVSVNLVMRVARARTVDRSVP